MRSTFGYPVLGGFFDDIFGSSDTGAGSTDGGATSFDEGTSDVVDEGGGGGAPPFNGNSDSIPASNRRLGLTKTKQVQQRLTDLGFNTFGVDGQWGPNTQGAFVNFQISAGITVDGIYGPQSDSALFAGAGAVTLDIDTPATPPFSPPVSPVVDTLASAPDAGSSNVLLIAGGAILVGGLIYMASKKKRGAR